MNKRNPQKEKKKKMQTMLSPKDVTQKLQDSINGTDINCDSGIHTNHNHQHPSVHIGQQLKHISLTRRETNSSKNNEMSWSSGANMNDGCPNNIRRKTSLHYQQKLMTNKESNTEEPEHANINSKELFLNHSKLPTPTIERYEDTLSCCLPPPSPAPNSDHFVSDTCIVTSSKTASDIQPKLHHQLPFPSSNSTSALTTNSLHGGNSCSASNVMKSTINSASGISISVTSACGTPSVHQPSHKYSSFSHSLLGNFNVAEPIAQRPASPSSNRYRLAERYRDSAQSLNCSSGSTAARYAPSTMYFLGQGTTHMVAGDTYSYMSSTVHTPIKRYVPTPPPHNEFYPTETNGNLLHTPAASSVMSKCDSNNSSDGNDVEINVTNTTNFAVTTQHLSTLPIRVGMRIRCCSSETTGGDLEQALMQTQPLNTNQSLTSADLYSTSPRLQTSNVYNNGSLKMNANSANFTVVSSALQTTSSSLIGGKDSPSMNLHDQQQQISLKRRHSQNFNNSISSSNYISSALSSLSPTLVVNDIANLARHTTSRTTPCLLNDFNEHPKNHALDYVSTLQPDDPAANWKNNINNGIGNGSTLPATCMHCKTVRRTTGVHQTTQTTGPISPIPMLTSTQPTIHANNRVPVNLVGGVAMNLLGSNDQSNFNYVLSPSTTESHISPLTPQGANAISATLQQPQQAERLLNKKTNVFNHQQHQQYSEIKSNNHVLTTPDHLMHLEQQQVTSAQIISNSAGHMNAVQQLQVQQQPTAVAPQSSKHQRVSTKRRLTCYVQKKISRFFGVNLATEIHDYALWQSRQRRLALRRFGTLKTDSELQDDFNDVCSVTNDVGRNTLSNNGGGLDIEIQFPQHHQYHHHHYHHQIYERPDILPARDADEENIGSIRHHHQHSYFNINFHLGDNVERKASVASMLISSFSYVVHAINNHQPRLFQRQWSRSFLPAHVQQHISNDLAGDNNCNIIYDDIVALQEDEIFYDSSQITEQIASSAINQCSENNFTEENSGAKRRSVSSISRRTERQLYLAERVNGWRINAMFDTSDKISHSNSQPINNTQQQQQLSSHRTSLMQTQKQLHHTNGIRACRISSQLLDSVLENSRRPIERRVKLFCINDLDDRTDHRPFFTYWINTVQIIVLTLSLLCYGIGPIGFGIEHRTGQVLVTSLSLQTVQHNEQRNVWIGPRNNDLVHMGANFATCMRRDVKIMDIMSKTRRQERETACCIRNDDSGCVQSSQADCSVRGLFPTKSISTWKKWSPGDSGPGGRISGSVCGLDPKYCDAPASIAPYEWPDDITKWPICRKTNSFSQRFRFKDHTAEHMVCEVIGHPCCTGVYGECRITTREYCDFVNGYFHEEASLCSQISCLSNICGMFPFVNIEVPDQFYRLFTSLCIHAGILHLVITVVFQHFFLADLERLMGPLRTAILYIGSGLAGNLTSSILVPYKPEVGPLASLSGVTAALVVLLTFTHWKQLRKPHLALFKLLIICGFLLSLCSLPWQSNFTGLLAGTCCGIFLTMALVPFVSINRYRRKPKINIIWSCIIFHMVIYTTMLITFYMFPMELTKLNLVDVLTSTTDKSSMINTRGDIISGSSDGMNSNNNRHSFMPQQQHHHHHQSNDIISNSVSAAFAAAVLSLFNRETNAKLSTYPQSNYSLT
ncbi:inactive rhomboid protein 1 [Glossina fuscipes]|uniref:Inactive rhomboid protein 1 n=1 Tax=Glossina fuscipes TaxID=7396 RepID=A0A9C6E076_9MUSC|nr:inactive rhomboid protein 1 [Glossina fuscipes]